MAMQGSATKTLSQRWDDYRPTKSTLVWACIGAAVVTMIVGFTWGGWMTGKTSRELASAAGSTARGELAGQICVDRFRTAPDSAARLTELKALSGAFAQRQFVEAGGWATMPGQTTPDRRGAEACAAALVA
ncbi:hypothetical protein [Mesorhizobium australicum]|uniref:Uncharacterized protein n=1 Tax=Mesorhizobium australicum TaxID=536018 RepID=A0A1X7PU10_9HYPH|nr:hypothetical protein [Mesorhizobium australicum]SMH54806.1 hypothetical protein SAMN02982922_5220 [Mesorhizobium australicum]